MDKKDNLQKTLLEADNPTSCERALHSIMNTLRRVRS